MKPAPSDHRAPEKPEKPAFPLIATTAHQTAAAPSVEGLLRPFLEPHLPWLYVDSLVWTGIGLSGAAIFSSRFLIQWLQSEKEKRIVVPALFWYLSFWGSVINLIYALHIDKLPVILGCCFLPFLYGRNLVLLHRSEKRTLRG